MAAAFNKITGGFFFSTVIQGRDISVTLPREIALALHGLPEGSRAFTGRSEAMAELLATLAPPTRTGTGSAAAVVVSAVAGLGGIGKTELAVQAAREALTRGWFPGGALFVDMFGYDRPRRLSAGAALDGWLRALGIPGEHIPARTQDRARLFRSVLSKFAEEGRRILVVVDNVSRVDQVRPLLPTDGATGAIVTSRNDLSILDARIVDLDVLRPQDGLDLLSGALGVRRPGDTRVSDDPESAARIIELCAGLPLAVKIVAARLAGNRVQPLSAMAAELAESSSRTNALKVADVAVCAAFETSHQYLAPGQARLFRLIALNPGPDISTEAAAALGAIRSPAARQILDELKRTSLIDHGNEDGRWRMHDLVRLYAAQLSDGIERADALVALLGYYVAQTKAACAFIGSTAATDSDAFENRGAAIGWLDAERLNLVAAVHLATTAGHEEVLALAQELAATMSRYLDWRRHFNDGVAVASTELSAARRRNDIVGEAAAQNHLGVAYRRLRQFEKALPAHQAAIAISCASEDRRGEARGIANLAIVLRQTHRNHEAVKLHKAAIAMFDETGDEKSAAEERGCLSAALHELGQFDDAVRAAEDAVAVFDRAGDQAGLSGALTNLGIMLRSVGRHDEALAAHQQDLAICRQALDRHGEGQAIGNIGTDMRLLGRLDEAAVAAGEAAAIFRETLDQHAEGMAYDNLGNVLQVAGRYEEAVAAYEKALVLDTQDDHGDAITLDNLASAFDLMRQPHKAIAARERAVAIFQGSADRRREARTMDNLGTSLKDARRIAEAMTAHQAAADIFRQLGDTAQELAAVENLEKAQAELQ